MKKYYYYLLFACSMLFAFNANSQNCRIIKDSVSAGDQATSYSIYHYNNLNKIVKVDFYDSASNSINAWDTITYNVNDLVYEVESFYSGNGVADRTVRFTYDLNNKITRIFESGTNNIGPWAKAYDLSYNPSGFLTDLDYDLSSVVGSPDGFNASFKNITWLNGNIMFVDIIGDLGGGMDTLELEVLSDSKNNINHKLYISEAPDVLMHSNLNNIIEITFRYNETMGPMGTKALKNSFTYNVNNDVETWSEHPAVFEDDFRTTLYSYDCSVAAGIKDINNNLSLTIFPNPFTSSFEIYFSDLDYIFDVSGTIKDITGKTIAEKSETVMNSKLIWTELDALANGYYLLQLEINNTFYSYKILKN